MEIIILRTLGFIPYLIIALIYSVSGLIKYMINYCLYGIESIVYTEKNQRKKISDIYDKVDELIKRTPNKGY